MSARPSLHPDNCSTSKSTCRRTLTDSFCRARPRRCANILPDLFASGKLKANPIRSFDGGLDNITEGLEYLKAGKVRHFACLEQLEVQLTIPCVAELGPEGHVQDLDASQAVIGRERMQMKYLASCVAVLAERMAW